MGLYSTSSYGTAMAVQLFCFNTCYVRNNRIIYLTYLYGHVYPSRLTSMSVSSESDANSYLLGYFWSVKNGIVRKGSLNESLDDGFTLPM